MTTQRQWEANKRNAQKSTGPRTEEGKAQSRQNATKHNLAGDGPVVQDAFATMVAIRMEHFRPVYNPTTPSEEWLLKEVATAVVRLDHARKTMSQVLMRSIARAEESWDEDQIRAAVKLAAKLKTRPELTLHQLRRTRHGCLWLADQWLELAITARQRPWNELESTHAYELLGYELYMRGSIPWSADPAAFAQEQAEDHAELAQRHERDDAICRNAAQQGLQLEESDELKLVRRYENTFMRRHEWAHRQLKALSNQSEYNQPSVDQLSQRRPTPRIELPEIPDAADDLPNRADPILFPDLKLEPRSEIALALAAAMAAADGDEAADAAGSLKPTSIPSHQDDRRARRRREKQARKRSRR